jgi:hypothetical protein
MAMFWFESDATQFNQSIIPLLIQPINQPILLFVVLCCPSPSNRPIAANSAAIRPGSASPAGVIIVTDAEVAATATPAVVGGVEGAAEGGEVACAGGEEDGVDVLDRGGVRLAKECCGGRGRRRTTLGG